MASNAAAVREPAGNLKPAKDKSTARICGIVAIIMAIGSAMACEQPVRSSTRTAASSSCNIGVSGGANTLLATVPSSATAGMPPA